MTDIRFYLKLLSRRFPAMAFLFLLASSLGVIAALRLPTMYSTQATLLVESAQIDDVASAQASVNEQLDIIQQRLLTRANVIDVARKNNVFPNQRQMDPDAIVREMRRRTRVRRSGGRNEAPVMTISFQGPNPRKVAAVVNQYVNVVLEIYNDVRVGVAVGALEFFDQEVARLSQELDLQSGKIVAFKSKNADALPENLDYRLNQQSLFQERLARAERDLEATRAQRANLMRIYESSGTLGLEAGPPASPEEARMRELESQLRVALSIYSETNPKVKLLRNQIAALESQIQAVSPGVDGAEGEDGEAPKSVQSTALDISLAELDTRIENLNQEITVSTEKLASLQDSIDRTPANRIALEALERDLENIRALHSGAVTRLAEARMGERIELSAKGERITVLEPASVPTTPSSPNRPAIAGMGVAIGLGLAGGLFVLLELFNQAIRRPADIVKALDITPLATVPRFETVADRRWRRSMQLMALAVVIVAVPSLLWGVDTYYMPLEDLFAKIQDRF